jgi:hypothetical protein
MEDSAGSTTGCRAEQIPYHNVRARPTIFMAAVKVRGKKKVILLWLARCTVQLIAKEDHPMVKVGAR